MTNGVLSLILLFFLPVLGIAQTLEEAEMKLKSQLELYYHGAIPTDSLYDYAKRFLAETDKIDAQVLDQIEAGVQIKSTKTAALAVIIWILKEVAKEVVKETVKQEIKDYKEGRLNEERKAEYDRLINEREHARQLELEAQLEAQRERSRQNAIELERRLQREREKREQEQRERERPIPREPIHHRPIHREPIHDFEPIHPDAML